MQAMETRKLTLDEIRYNPERGAFEAQVRIRQGDDWFSYPAQVCAPLHADYAHVMRGLVADAETAHRGKRAGLRLRLAPAPALDAPMARASTMAQLQRKLGGMAA
jgi:hypothetical protein